MFLRRKKSRAELVKERVHDLTETLSDRAVDLTEWAAIVLSPKVDTAREVATTAYEQASTKVRDEVVPKVRDEYVPRVRDAAVPAVAGMLAKTPLAKQPEPEPKTHRLLNLVLLLGLGAVAAYLIRRFTSGASAPTSSFSTAPDTASTYTVSESTPARPTAVPDARGPADPLQGGDAAAPGATFADADSELSADIVEELNSADEPVVLVEPVEVTPGESTVRPDPDGGVPSKPRQRPTSTS